VEAAPTPPFGGVGGSAAKFAAEGKVFPLGDFAFCYRKSRAEDSLALCGLAAFFIKNACIKSIPSSGKKVKAFVSA